MKKRNILIGIIILNLFYCCNQNQKGSIEENKSIFIKNAEIVTKYTPIDSSGEYIIAKKDNYFGLINNKKQLILPFDFDSITHPHLKDYYFISKNKLFGVVGNNGKIIIPFEYEKIAITWYEEHNSNEDTFIVQKNGKLGTVDFYNKVIIPLEYDGITDWVENGPGAHYVKKNNFYGIIRYNGQIPIPIIYDKIHCYSYNLIKVKLNGKNGVINNKNETIIPCIYDSLMVNFDLFGFSKNHKNKFIVKNNNQWFYLDSNGKLLKSNVTIQELKNSETYLDFKDYDYTYIDLCMIFAKNKTLHDESKNDTIIEIY